jgi:hypothetical protein
MNDELISYATFTNEDFDAGFLLEDEDGPVDLTGSEFIVHIRQAVENLALILEASTENGMLVIADQEATGEMGLVEFAIPASVAATIPVGTYPYDILWISPEGARDNIGGGTITFQRGVTRIP